MAAADAPTIARQAAEIAELQRQLATADAEADYWRNENASIREAAAHAMTDALNALRPHVEWEAKLATAVERASALEQQLVAADARQAAEIAELQHKFAAASAAESYWQQRHHEAWTLIGRVDFAIEQASKAKNLRDARAWVARARREIAAGSAPRKAKEGGTS